MIHFLFVWAIMTIIAMIVRNFNDKYNWKTFFITLIVGGVLVEILGHFGIGY